MARHPRLDPENGIHHVYNRGTRHWTVFIDDVDRVRFLRHLGSVCNRYGTKVLAYCLMGNHFHLVLQCPDKHLSDALRDLKSRYVRYFNRKHGYSGTLFEARFQSKLVTTETQLRTLVRYVFRNPYGLDDGIDLSSYQWSSYPETLGSRASSDWLDCSYPLELFGNCVHTLRSEVETPRANDAVRNSTTQRGSVIHKPSATTHGFAPTLATILLEVARASDRPLHDVKPRLRNGLIGIAVVIAIDVGGYTAKELALPYGFANPESARRSAQRSKLQMQTDPSLAAVHGAVLQRLAPR